MSPSWWKRSINERWMKKEEKVMPGEVKEETFTFMKEMPGNLLLTGISSSEFFFLDGR
jgi:hypothetical protein